MTLDRCAFKLQLIVIGKRLWTDKSSVISFLTMYVTIWMDVQTIHSNVNQNKNLNVVLKKQLYNNKMVKPEMSKILIL